MTFSLPQKDYKVRADYPGGQYWSEVFNAQNVAINIDHGYANTSEKTIAILLFSTDCILDGLSRIVSCSS